MVRNSKLTVARVSNKYVDQIYDLERRIFLLNECFSRSQLRYLSSSPNASFFLLRDGDVPVGFGITLKGKLRNGLHKGRIYSIGVLPEYRNRGAGNLLLNVMEEYLIKSHVSFIVLETLQGKSGAELFFAEHGYKTLGSLPNYYPNGNGVRMKKTTVRW